MDRTTRIVFAELTVDSREQAELAGRKASLLARRAGIPAPDSDAFSRTIRRAATHLASQTGPRIVLGVTPIDGMDRVEAEFTNLETDGARNFPGVAECKVEFTDAGLHLFTMTTAMLSRQSEQEIAEWRSLLSSADPLEALITSRQEARRLVDRLSSVERQLSDAQSHNETLALLSLVASKTDNAVIIMDEVGAVTWVNDAFIRMTGLSLLDATGTRPDAFFCDTDVNDVGIESIGRAFHSGHGVAEELLQLRKDGSRSWMSLSLTPVHDDDGAVNRWIGIGGDITRRREAQQALEAARDAAESANRMKSEFLANISHEIRTPMNAIIGMTELALGTDLTVEQSGYLSTVARSAESLLELLNDVLDLSRIEAGRMEIDTVPFRLEDLLRETLGPLEILARRKGVLLSCPQFSPSNDRRDEMAVTSQFLLGDPTRLRQVLVNLVGNAIKFTEEGQVRVDVTSRRSSESTVELDVVVEDTGIGIPIDKLERIFDSFTQADPSVARTYGGSGLGLTISSELIQLMGGQLNVESVEERGSRFSCSIPLAIASDDHNVTTTTVRETAATSIGDILTQPLRILIADDHEANRQLATRILEGRGHITESVSNGKEVLRSVERADFDLILMDVQMPEVDGLDAAARLRERELHSGTHMPIIAVTAHAMKGDRERCLAAGMDAYLSKPIRAGELITLVESIGGNQVNITPRADMRLLSSQSQESVTAAPPHTFAAALDRLGGDEELLHEQLEFFLRDAPVLLEQIFNAIANAEDATLRIPAHRLKGLCAGFDAEKAALAAHQLEQVSLGEMSADASALADALSAELTRLIGTIETFLTSSAD